MDWKKMMLLKNISVATGHHFSQLFSELLIRTIFGTQGIVFRKQ